jgi:hypothetical protein
LLRELGIAAPVEGEGDHPALAWRRAGLVEVTGRTDGPGLVCPTALTTAADGALLALKALAPDPALLPENGALLLGERARLLRLTRGGRISANRSCRLVDTRDGRIALNLARVEDWDLIPAWLQAEAGDWSAIEAIAATRPTADLMARGGELGLPLAAEPRAAPRRMRSMPDKREIRDIRPRPAPLVLDLSSLWAGPLAGSLLAMLGARVTKLESLDRPDGARRGNADFFALLNSAKRSVAIDFADRAMLAGLVRGADIVIEGSRPRALRQLGIDADAEVARGAVWISITAHGREGNAADRVGFGDDAAIAAGLSRAMAAGHGDAIFAGDAIADPLTGLHAALAGWGAWLAGGGRLCALSLSGVVRRVIEADAGVSRGRTRAWQAMARADRQPLYAPRQAPPILTAPGPNLTRVPARC